MVRRRNARKFYRPGQKMLPKAKGAGFVICHARAEDPGRDAYQLPTNSYG